MKIILKNIAKVADAEIEINGITVIGGENNTGKSTIGKALFAVFNSFYHIEQQIYSERFQNTKDILDMIMRNYFGLMTLKYYADTEEFAEELLESRDKYLDNIEQLREDIYLILTQYENFSEKNIDNIKDDESISRLKAALSISDQKIFLNILTKKLNAEFNGQVNNIDSKETGIIQLEIRGERILVTVKDNFVEFSGNEISLGTEVVYLDDPFVLDEKKSRTSKIVYEQNHKEHLKYKLLSENIKGNIVNEILAADKIEIILGKLNSVCGGDIVKSSQTKGLAYKREGSDKVLDIKNISTGLKTFAIMKKMLLDGLLEMNGTIILDEPEIHLHPEWQLVFAELIVLIQKEFDMHILINTHSPYFLNAIEVYAQKHGIASKCKYYLSEAYENMARFKDVSDNIEEIYERLARPLQILENLTYDED